MRRRNRNRNNIFMVLLLLLIGLGIGYALLTADINIVGVSQIADKSWSIHFDNLEINDDSVDLSTGDVAASINASDDTLVEYTITLNVPGDFYEFTVDAVNDGSIDGMIGEITSKLNGEPISATNPLPANVTYSVTYEDGVPLALNHLLAVGASETYKVRVEFIKDVEASELSDTDINFVFSFGVKYVQRDENAIERPQLGEEYLIQFNSQGGSTTPSITRGEDEALGKLPKATKDGFVFDGWFDDPEEGNQITASTVPNASITYYAHWTPLVCRKVTQVSDLHQETCISGGGCTDKYSVGDPIRYGTLVDGRVKAGDAYDCKLTTNGNYDKRFYFIRTTDNDNVALIAYAIIVGGEFKESGDTTQLEYEQALAAMPDATSWNNITETFTFNSVEKAARPAYVEDIMAACSLSTIATGNGSLSHCDFIFEKSKFATNNGRSATWLLMHNDKYYRYFTTTQLSLQTPDTGAGSKNSVRPVIEVPLRLVEDAEKLNAVYQVIFNGNGGEISGDSTLEDEKSYEETLGTLPVPTRTHYIFNGWWTEEEDGVQITSASTVTDDVEYFAHWKKDVSLAEVTNSEIHLVAGLTETINIANLQELGETYTFQSSNDSVAVVSNEGVVTAVTPGTATITITGATSSATKTVSVSVTANIGTYTVTFNSMGGTPQEVEYTRNANEVIGGFPQVSKEHFVLDGWYTEEDAGTKITESATVVQDVVYYAHWKKAISQAVIASDPLTVAANEADVIIISNASDIGETYTFTSNNTAIATVDSTGRVTGVTEGNTTVTITGNISGETKTVNIHVSAELITIYFDEQGGTTVDDRQIPSGAAIGTLPTTTQSGYVFDGWYDAASGGNLVSATDTFLASTHIYAHWTALLCTAVKEETDLDTQSCASASGKGCLASGYLSGETITYGSLATGAPEAGNAYDCVVYKDAYDYVTERFYFVRQNGNNGVLVSNTIASLANQGVVGPTNESLQYTEALDALPSTSQWNNLPVTFTLTDLNNTIKPARLLTLADVSAACEVTATTGTSIPLPACEFLLESSGYGDSSGNNGRSGFWISKNGSTFYRIMGTDRKVVSPNDGTSANSSKPVIEVPMNLIETVVIPHYNIVFHSNEGSSVPDKEIIGEKPMGVMTTPTRSGYTFEGWYTDQTYTTRVTPKTIVNSSMDLYASWERASTTFPYVFRVLGECDFKGEATTGNNQNTNAANIESLECIGLDNTDYTTGKYIDTNVSLYSTTNIGKDFEIGFTINSYTPNSYRETLVNTKKEENPYPGLTFRRKDADTSLFVLQSRKTSSANMEQTFTMSDVHNVKIRRIDGEISYQINDDEPIDLHALSDYGTYPKFDLTTWFGAAPANAAATSSARHFRGTMSNMYIKLGTYEDSSTYKVTFNPMGGEVTPTSMKVPKDTALSSLPTPTKQGNTFVAWYTEPTGGVPINPSATITQNVIYYARWVANVEGATINTTDTVINLNGSKQLTLTDTVSEIENYTFTSNDTSIAVVNSTGLITPVAVGTTTITIEGNNSHTTKTVNVEVMNRTVNPTTFNIDNSATATYFANKSTWNSDETSFMTAMDNNFSTNNCICNDNMCQYRPNISTTQTTYCDKPLHYNTNTNAALKVYTYDLTTNSTIDEVAYTRSSTGYIYNMIPGYTYYWKVANDPTQFGFVNATGNTRTIDIDGVRNVRDLGGQQVDVDGNGTIDGTVKYERLFRAERLWQSQPTHVTAMENLGVTEEIDLRASSEIPSDESHLTNWKHREIKHYQIDQANYPSYYTMARDVITETMQDVVNGENVFFHCRIGADRTGTLAYILEGLLGVVDEDRFVDYELSYYAGLVKRNRYYYEDPQSSVSKTEKFGYMYNIIPTANAVYQWYMAGSTNQSSDQALITSFRNAMIDYNS